MRDIPTQLTMQETTKEYEQFIEKFKPKKTTDDCFTPPNIYEAGLNWVCNEYGVNRSDVVRPFYPGGDYERYEYEENSVVVDNPPFSIISQIVNFYNSYGIRYFLFAPHLTNLQIGRGEGCCHVITNASITYENGATVNTSFVTNLDDRLIYAPADLHKLIEAQDKINRKEKARKLPKYEFPDNVVTAAKIGWIVDKGITYELKKGQGVFIRNLESMKRKGKNLFGSGFLISEKAAAEKAAAEKAAAEKWQLSRRELEIIKQLGENK